MSEFTLQRYARALLNRSLEENVRRARYRLIRASRRLAGEFRVATRRGYPKGKRLRNALKPGQSVTNIMGPVHGAQRPRFLVDVSERVALVAAIERLQPDAVELAVAEAERVLRHEFDLLGSGPVDLGSSIDWHRDFKSGYRWPERLYYGRIYGRPRAPGADIKVPWELSRAQFLPTLGRAYWYTRDERYAAEYVRLVEDWLDHNHPEAGVNWACPMDVAIRAVNWLWAYHLIADSVSVTQAFESRLTAGLLAHGRHLARNLEGAPGRVNSNHYLSDIAGLLFLGLLLPEFEESDGWRATAEKALVREMDDQVLDGGVDWEMSTSYHRLVTEIFLTCAVLYERNGGKLPSRFSERLSSMIDYTFHYTRPDGTAPIICDADNGRLQRLTTWREPQREFQDHRHLLAAGAVLFDRADWAASAGPCWEEALWLLGETAEQRLRSLSNRASTAVAASRDAKSRGFERAGIYVMRSAGLYSIVNARAGDLGGPTSHLHNDQLSFEIFAGGAPFLVDPGSYVYTADPVARNAFRSSRSHNGLVVDDREANPFDPKVLFGMEHCVGCTVESWVTDEDKDLLVASHSGFGTLPDPVVLRRSWLFDKAKSLWIVWDRVEAGAAHSYLLPLQFGRDVTVEVNCGPTAVRARNAQGQLLDVRVLLDPGLSVTSGEDWVSMSYGRRSRAARVELRFVGEGALDLVWALVPEGPQETDDGGQAALDQREARLHSAVQLFRQLDPTFPCGGE